MVAHGLERVVPLTEHTPIIKTEALRALVALAAHGGISRAAAALGEPKSTVSRLLNELERTVGATLLKRERSGVSLTEAGEAMHAHAVGAIRLLGEAVAAARTAESKIHGELVVCVPHLFAERLLVSRLPEYFAEHPGVSIRLVSAGVAAGEVNSAAHISICVGPLPDVDMVKRRIGTSRLKIYAAPRCAEAMAQLENPSLIVGPDLLGSPTIGNCNRVIDFNVMPPMLRAEILEPQGRYLAVRNGVGAAWLPAFLCNDDVARGDLIDVNPVHDFGPIEINALYDHHLTRVQRVRSFVSFLQRIVGTLA